MDGLVITPGLCTVLPLDIDAEAEEPWKRRWRRVRILHADQQQPASVITDSNFTIPAHEVDS
jgi:hypothetical protein